MNNQQKFKDKCQKHPQNKIEYMRINNNGQSKSKQFFYCLKCINLDSSFVSNDYLYIKDTINFDYEEILHKWPPINNPEITEKLRSIMKGSQNKEQVVEQIIQFFNQLKITINNSIDICQKRMIQIAEAMPDNNNNSFKEEIIKKYEEISQVRLLRDSLLNNNQSIEEKERICNQLVEQQTKQSNNINQLLMDLYNQFQPKTVYQPESAQLIQSSILSYIDSINLFRQSMKMDVKLIITEFNEGQKYLQISQNSNNQPQVTKIDGCSTYNVVSDLILDKDLKYVFRFQIDNLKNDQFVGFGLIQDKNKNNLFGFNEKLSCLLKKRTEQLYQDGRHGIEKSMRDNIFVLREQIQVEMRVCIKDQILEILDYPKYNFQLGISDKSIPLLMNAKDLRVYIGMGYTGTQVTLIDSLIVDNLDSLKNQL